MLGAGLPGLVMACGGLVALGRRRRQKIRKSPDPKHKLDVRKRAGPD
jgi:hypothetical protein